MTDWQTESPSTPQLSPRQLCILRYCRDPLTFRQIQIHTRGMSNGRLKKDALEWHLGVLLGLGYLIQIEDYYQTAPWRPTDERQTES